MNKRKGNEKGITLIALVLTIIIMSILAGISFNAIAGENGILGQAMEAKIKNEDESAKEELSFAWSARMTKFYEDISSGKATWDDIKNYFSEDELNSLLGNNGKIEAMTYDIDTEMFSVVYTSNEGILYIGDVKKSGEISNLVRTDGYTTEVWVSYYEDGDNGALIYSNSKEDRWRGKEPKIQWDITDGISAASATPWGDYNSSTNSFNRDTYIRKIKTVEVLNKIVPKETNGMFYSLESATTFNNLSNVDYSFCKKIGDNQFYECYNLTDFVVPDTVRKIGKYGFAKCNGLNNVTLSQNIIDIDEYAFAACTNLMAIDLPDTVKNIGDFAFYYCHLENLTIPENVTSIGKNCFIGCIFIDTVYYNAIDARKSDFYSASENGYIIPFYYDSPIVNNVVIGDKVKYIPDYMFCQTKISSIVIPDSVIEIGRNSFSSCYSIETVKLGKNLNKIGVGAFYRAAKLYSVEGGENVVTIDNGAFNQCVTLVIFEMHDKVETIGNDAFSYDTFLRNINFPDSLTRIGDNAFDYCNTFTEITIPKNIKYLGKSAFADCSNLTNINYNAENASESNFVNLDDETYVANPPFYGSGKNLKISSAVRYLPDYLFAASTVENITIENGLHTIGWAAFASCFYLETITIPNSVLEIGEYTFSNCIRLRQIIIQKPANTIPGSPWIGTDEFLVQVVWSST